jgi:ATP-dependent helicase/nuclease subunit A
MRALTEAGRPLNEARRPSPEGDQLRIEGLDEPAGAAPAPATAAGAPPAPATAASGTAAAPGAGLTDEQELAVARRSGPLALSAAAGSGKTSVIVERFVRAVCEDAVAPARILAITFTERAAGELRERVRARLLERGERETERRSSLPAQLEAAFVDTFHGFCARLLRAHALLAGLEPDFAILDEGLAARLRGEAFRSALRAFVRTRRPEAVDLLAAYGVERAQAMVVGVHAQLRSRGQRRPRLPAPAPTPVPRLWSGRTNGEAEAGCGRERDDAEAAAACVLLDELLAAFGDAYEALKRERGAVDFDDLELGALALLEGHDGARAAWSERFELLMVDEFQDTNPRQLAILRALERDNLFTVGDEHQSIYGFRHADVGLFRARREELRGRGGCLALTRNHRSRAPLLRVVNAVFAERLEDFEPMAPAREDADAREPLVDLLLTARGGWEGAPGERVAAGLPPAPPWRQAEALALARHVDGLVRREGVAPGDVVVLLRALGDVEVYERALQLHGLSTLAAVGAFWEHQQVVDVLAYLRALANPLDELALYATLASPLAGLSRDALALLARAAHAGGRSAWETAVGAAERPPEGMRDGERDALVRFCARLRAERATASLRPIAQLIERVVQAGGYREHVLGLPSGERGLANVHKLMRLARRFEASEGRDLRAFLDHVAHLSELAGGEANAPVDAGEPHAVRLMSIHAAKGLEFPVVCVADLGRAPNTRVPDLLVDGERIGLALVRLDGRGATPALDYERLCDERRRAEAEEEDRIVYVAMTRARERLVLSGAIDLERWSERRPQAGAISWLGPALAADLPNLARAAPAQAHVHDVPIGPLGDAHVRVSLNGPASFAEAPLARAPAAGPGGPRAQAPGGRQASGGPQPAGASEAPRGGPDAAGGVCRPGHAPGRAAAPDGALGGGALSYTALSELERCGYRFYLERVLGLPERRADVPGARSAGGLDARARGTLAHRLLEEVDFARPAAPSPVHVARVAEALGMRTSAGEREELAVLLEAALRCAPARRVARARRVRREVPFAFAVAAEDGAGGLGGGRLVAGVIDVLAVEADGGCVVLDYKSDRVGAEVDLEALAERDYGVQRLLYALAVLRDGCESVEVVHWFLERPEEWVGARFVADDAGALQARLAERLARVREDPFAVSRHPHRGLCLTCPARAGLCSWSERETLREQPSI